MITKEFYVLKTKFLSFAFLQEPQIGVIGMLYYPYLSSQFYAIAKSRFFLFVVAHCRCLFECLNVELFVTCFTVPRRKRFAFFNGIFLYVINHGSNSFSVAMFLRFLLRFPFAVYMFYMLMMTFI